MTFISSFVPRSKTILLLQLISASVICFFLVTSFGFKDYYRPSITNQLSDLDSSSSASTKRNYPYTIVTGSSANHICSLENFLYSLDSFRSEIDAFPRIVVYNIGMNRTQLPILDQLQSNGLVDDVILFDHERYPAFWDVAVNAGEYAWKTGIVNDARIRYGGVLIWLDAGNQVTSEFLTNIPHVVRNEFHGFWSPRSDHNMLKWTHPGMFKFFNADIKEYRYKRNCNGAAIGFDSDNHTIVSDIIAPWYECGLQKKCVAPPGSSRENHRQDQAVLTYLAYLHGHECTVAPRDFALYTHRDKSCRSELMNLDLQNKLHHPSAIDFVKWERVDTIDLYYHPEWKYPEDKVPVNLRKPAPIL